jgi:hypothetical protein
VGAQIRAGQGEIQARCLNGFVLGGKETDGFRLVIRAETGLPPGLDVLDIIPAAAPEHAIELFHSVS